MASRNDSTLSEREKWQKVLNSSDMQRLFKEELGIKDDKARLSLEKEILKSCNDIVKTKTHERPKTSKIKLKRQDDQTGGNMIKQQPLTMLQRKELERQLTLDYLQFPAQPCVRSLYYLSKIAQTQSLKIIVPPTVLLGLNDDNRIMYNDYQTGLLVVESKNISPKRIQSFIQTHMVDTPDSVSSSIEDKLLFPKFLIKLAGKGSVANDMRIFYSKEAMIPELLSLWGSYDLALQGFVKQRHPLRPSMHRLFVNKNGHVYKAVSINNQENMNKDSKLYQLLLQLIEDAHNKSIDKNHHRHKSETRNHPQIVGGDLFGYGGPRHSISVGRVPRGSIVQTMDQFNKNQLSQSILARRRSTIVQEPRVSQQKTEPSKIVGSKIEEEGNGGYLGKLNEKGFPISLEHFKLADYYSSISQSIPNSDLKKAFTCTTDNIDNLTMMNCRPSALQQASLMTTDLYRLFSQYYLKIQKFGHISQFVCDFIEDQNGLMYLLQVKSFECEGIRYDWQLPFNPVKSGTLQQHIALIGANSPVKPSSLADHHITSEQLKLMEEKQQFDEMESKCQATLICRDNKHQPRFKEWFVQACKEREMWDFSTRPGYVPMVLERHVKKFKQEIELGKECFCLQSEKIRISPFFPLIAFCDRLVSNSPQKVRPSSSLQTKSVSIRLAGDVQQASGNEQEVYEVQGNPNDDHHIPACYSCFKVMELFAARYYALVFKTEQTVEELRKLKLKLVNHWTQENVQFIVSLYKDAKKSLYIVGDIEKIEKRVFEQAVRQRAKSPESVMRRTIGNSRRPQSALKRSSTCQKLEYSKEKTFEEVITIEERVSTAPQSQGKRPLLRCSKSFLRSIDRFQKLLEEQEPSPMKGSRPFTPSQIQSSNPLKKSYNKRNTQPHQYEAIVEMDGPYNDSPVEHRFNDRHDAKLSANLSNSKISQIKPEYQDTQGLPSRSSQFSSRNVPLKNQKNGRSSIISLLSSFNQRSDKDMNAYFNNKRELSRGRVLLTHR